MPDFPSRMPSNIPKKPEPQSYISVGDFMFNSQHPNNNTTAIPEEDIKIEEKKEDNQP